MDKIIVVQAFCSGMLIALIALLVVSIVDSDKKSKRISFLESAGRIQDKRIDNLLYCIKCIEEEKRKTKNEPVKAKKKSKVKANGSKS